MTDAFSVRDALSRGLGRAATLIGEPYDVFRPRGTDRPLATGNIVMRMPVLLADAVARDPGVPGAPVLRASFDGVSARVGDYLRGPRGVLFIATLPARRRPCCVLTNMSVNVCRARGPSAAGLNGYGGVTMQSLEFVMRDWPVRAEMQQRSERGVLPVDRARSAWWLWFPPTPVAIVSGDVIVSEGSRYLVSLAEQTEAGWKLSVSGAEV